MKSQNLFNSTTGHKLEALFHNLPEVFFWTVISTRVFIMIPLFLAARIHFDFLDYPILVNATAAVSVFIVETILTLPSLATPHFQRLNLNQYRRVALRSTLVFGLFNQGLIVQSWLDLDMRWQALLFYSFVNVATIILAEFIGVMIGTKSQSIETEPLEETALDTPIPDISDNTLFFPDSDESYSKNGLPQTVETILGSDAPNKQKGLLLLELGYNDNAVANLLGVVRQTVYRWRN